MDASITDNGGTTRWMGVVFLPGQMEEDTRANTLRIESRASGSFYWPDGRKYIGLWFNGK
jgi:hypothetical protein